MQFRLSPCNIRVNIETITESPEPVPIEYEIMPPTFDSLRKWIFPGVHLNKLHVTKQFTHTFHL